MLQIDTIAFYVEKPFYSGVIHPVYKIRVECIRETDRCGKWRN